MGQTCCMNGPMCISAGPHMMLWLAIFRLVFYLLMLSLGDKVDSVDINKDT